MTKPLYLPDANLLIARAFEVHTHHGIASAWFNTPGLEWALCPFTEAAFVRFATDIRKDRGNLSMGEATAVLEKLTQHPGYRYSPFTHDWRTLTAPFFTRLHGHKQVTDAYLLGMAIHDGMILSTFDRAILHLAGENKRHIHVLGTTTEGRA